MEAKKSSLHRKVSEYVYSTLSLILAIFVCIIIIFTVFVRIVSVDGDSMNPTMLNGSKIIVSEFLYKPAYGDIIAFGKTGTENSSVIKRIIGMPGDVIDINFDTHILTVNGEVRTFSFDVTEPIEMKGDVEFPVTVPENCYFVLGDNRNNSLDSRFSEIGFVSYDEILGKAIFSLLPFGKLK